MSRTLITLAILFAGIVTGAHALATCSALSTTRVSSIDSAVALQVGQ